MKKLGKTTLLAAFLFSLMGASACPVNSSLQDYFDKQKQAREERFQADKEQSDRVADESNTSNVANYSQSSKSCPRSLKRGCNLVQVDCKSNTMTIDGQTSVVDCGGSHKSRQTTKTGIGRVGGRHKGAKIKNGVQIMGIAGMGASGGGKVFHVPGFKDARGRPQLKGTPRGRNDNPGGKGCIVICPQVLIKLRDRCNGVRLEIVGNDGKDLPSVAKNRGFAGRFKLRTARRSLATERR